VLISRSMSSSVWQQDGTQEDLKENPMHDSDPPDLDGGNDTDVLDFVIMEEIEKEMKNTKNSGCCLAIISVGSSLLAISWGLFKLS
jgi:hypothetical protein